MFRQMLALALVSLVSSSSFGRQLPSVSVQEQVRLIGQGAAVEVRMRDGSKLRGWIGEVSATGFELEARGHRLLPMTFDQVQAVKRVSSVRPSHTKFIVLSVVGVCGLVLLGLWSIGHGGYR